MYMCKNGGETLQESVKIVSTSWHLSCAKYTHNLQSPDCQPINIPSPCGFYQEIQKKKNGRHATNT